MPSRARRNEQRWTVLGIKARNAAGITVHGMNIDIRHHLTGLAVSGIHLSARTMTGLSVAPVTRVRRLEGVSVGAVNAVRRKQAGLTIGLLNWTSQLKGIQIGLLNHAGNNPIPFRWLPLINIHLRD